MIDFVRDRNHLISLGEAAKLMPPPLRGLSVHTSKLQRMIKSGRLEGVYVGRRWMTTAACIAEMIQRDTARFLRAKSAAELERVADPRLPATAAVQQQLVEVGPSKP